MKENVVVTAHVTKIYLHAAHTKMVKHASAQLLVQVNHALAQLRRRLVLAILVMFAIVQNLLHVTVTVVITANANQSNLVSKY